MTFGPFTPFTVTFTPFTVTFTTFSMTFVPFRIALVNNLFPFVVTFVPSPSPSPVEVSVKSAGRMSEVICAVRCGLDGTMFLTETGRVYGCGK